MIFDGEGDLKCQHRFFAQNIEASIIHPKIYPPSNLSIHPYILNINTLGILFSSNHNIHKSSCGHCFWASDPLIDGFS